MLISIPEREERENRTRLKRCDYEYFKTNKRH